MPALIDLARRALAHYQSGRHAEGRAVVREIIDTFSATGAEPEVLNQLGCALVSGGFTDDAAPLFEAILRHHPAHQGAVCNLVAGHLAAGRFEEGLRVAEGSPVLASSRPLRVLYARVLFSLERDVEAVAACEGLEADPEAVLVRATALIRLGRAAEALEDLGTLPEGTSRRDHLRGQAFTVLGRHAEALAAYDAAPADPDTFYHRGLAALRLGRLDEGWAGYDRSPNRPRRDYDAPRWDGSDLAGRHILVWREQGIGDELLYGSCLRDLARRAGAVTLECSPRLVGPFRRSFPDITVVTEAPEAFDVHLPMASLPRHLRRTPSDFAGGGAYLMADPAARAHWRGWLDGLGGSSVGLAWSSGRLGAQRRQSHFFTTLESWRGILAVPGVSFVNLMYTDVAAEIAGTPVRQPPDLDIRDDIEGLSALVAELDLVISVDTFALVHAAALGVETWALINPDNWHLLGTRRYPWFPDVRVFPVEGDADALHGKIAAELAQKKRPA